MPSSHFPVPWTKKKIIQGDEDVNFTKIRSEEPQSYRVVALSLIRRNTRSSLQRALELLVTIMEGKLDIRFEQIEVVVFMVTPKPNN